MGATHTASQALLGGTEALLEDVVGAVHHFQRVTSLNAGHGMAGEPVAVTVQIAEHDALGLEAAPRAGGAWSEPVAEILVVALQVGGDGLQAGRGGRGCEEGGRAGTARQFVLLQTQQGPQAAEHSPGPLQTVADACLGVQAPAVGQSLGGLPQQALLDARARSGRRRSRCAGNCSQRRAKSRWGRAKG